MIQRIQTLYLLIIVVLMVILLIVPLATFIGGTETFTLHAFGIKALSQGNGQIVPTLYMGILAVICTLIPVIAIFLYKRRWAQIRLCIAEIILLAGLQIFVAFYIYRSYAGIREMASHAISLSVVDVFPLVGLILAYLAFRGIARDEALIRSLNRMR